MIEYTLMGIEEKGRIYADLDNGIMKIIWQGCVDEKSAKNIMSICTDLASEDLCHKLIIDQFEFNSFSQDAITYLTDQFISECVILHEKIQKIAIIEPLTLIDSENVNLLDQLIFGKTFPSKKSKFRNTTDADVWLTMAA